MFDIQAFNREVNIKFTVNKLETKENMLFLFGDDHLILIKPRNKVWTAKLFKKTSKYCFCSIGDVNIR